MVVQTAVSNSNKLVVQTAVCNSNKMVVQNSSIVTQTRWWFEQQYCMQLKQDGGSNSMQYCNSNKLLVQTACSIATQTRWSCNTAVRTTILFELQYCCFEPPSCLSYILLFEPPACLSYLLLFEPPFCLSCNTAV